MKDEYRLGLSKSKIASACANVLQDLREAYKVIARNNRETPGTDPALEVDHGIACATVAFLKVNILHANRTSITPAGSAPFVGGDFAGLDVNALALPGVGRYLRRTLRWIDSVGSDYLHDEAVGKSRDRNLEVTNFGTSNLRWFQADFRPRIPTWHSISVPAGSFAS